MTRIPFDPETIQRLATILKECGLTELDMRDGETRLHLVRGVPGARAVVAAPPMAEAPVQRPAAPVAEGEAPPPEGAIPSPMVGIVFLAPEPGAAPYVTLGQVVTVGQTLLLIEAMKTFNQIKAPRAGTVTQILVAGGAPVEYGQPLVVIA